MPAPPPPPARKPPVTPAGRAAKGGKKPAGRPPVQAGSIPWNAVLLVAAVALLAAGYKLRDRYNAVEAALPSLASSPLPAGTDAFGVAALVRARVLSAGASLPDDGLEVTIRGGEETQPVSVRVRYRVPMLVTRVDREASLALTGTGLLPGRYAGDGEKAPEPDPSTRARLDRVLQKDRCPEGTEQKGFSPPQGLETWCEQPGKPGRQHGPYRGYHKSGQLVEEGEYLDGKRHGRWVKYSAEGSREAEAYYKAGVQHGRFKQWDAKGELVVDVEYRDGKPVR
ncbi:MAG: hypothetical protein HY904_02670 [Deltaproteobacteria bacterium]|nr:hypothetical protein [Deltaproteobacteria bacterium]